MSTKNTNFKPFNSDTTTGPFTAVVTNNDVEFYGKLHGASVVAGVLGGEVYFAETESGELVGIAVWFPPGRMMFDT